MRDKFPNNHFVEPQMGTSTRVLVGEAPGSDEHDEGRPFVGASGKLLNMLLGKAGIKRETLTVLNTIQCRPPNNDYPTDSDARSYISFPDAEKAVAHCFSAHVAPILLGRKWSRVDLLGDKALRAVTGMQEGISKWRGSPLAVPLIDPERPLAIATFHPSYLMRDQTMFPVAVNDLRKSVTPPPEHYNLYPSVEDVRNFTATEFAFDIETTREFNPRVKLVGLCARPYEAITVPFTAAYLPELKRIFTNAKKLIGHNLVQFDVPILFGALGIEWKP